MSKTRRVTFETTRGSFEISGEIMARAEATDDAFEIRRAFARNMPPEAKASRRERISGGGMRIHWRVIRIVPLEASAPAFEPVGYQRSRYLTER